MPDRAQLHLLEGQVVGLALLDGRRLEGCQLISAPRHGTRTMWLLTQGGDDLFVPLAAVAEIWRTETVAA